MPWTSSTSLCSVACKADLKCPSEVYRTVYRLFHLAEDPRPGLRGVGDQRGALPRKPVRRALNQNIPAVLFLEGWSCFVRQSLASMKQEQM